MFAFIRKKKRARQIYNNDLVGAIGKLPMHHEFIKHRVLLPELAQLDQWFSSAYCGASHRYGDKFKLLFTKMPIFNYLYVVATKKPMIGAVVPSLNFS